MAKDKSILSECQTVWIQICRVLIWVQTICKDYPRAKKVATGRQRVKFLMAMDKSMLFYVSFSLVQWLFIKFSDFTPLSETDMQIDKHNYIG